MCIVTVLQLSQFITAVCKKHYIGLNVLHVCKSRCICLGLPQYEATKAYMPKEPDELSLQQAELVIVLQTEEGETLSAPLLRQHGLVVHFTH